MLFRSTKPLDILEEEIKYLVEKNNWHDQGFNTQSLKWVADFVGNHKLYNVPLLAVAIVLYRSGRIHFNDREEREMLPVDYEQLVVDAELVKQIDNCMVRIWSAAHGVGIELEQIINLKLEGQCTPQHCKLASHSVSAAH